MNLYELKPEVDVGKLAVLRELYPHAPMMNWACGICRVDGGYACQELYALTWLSPRLAYCETWERMLRYIGVGLATRKHWMVEERTFERNT